MTGTEAVTLAPLYRLVDDSEKSNTGDHAQVISQFLETYKSRVAAE